MPDCTTVINAECSSGIATEKSIASIDSATRAQISVAADDALESRDAMITTIKVKLKILINKEAVKPVQKKSMK